MADATAHNEFDLFIVDLNGNLRGKRLLGSSIDKVFEEGVKLPRSVIGVDFWGRDVTDNGLVFETGDNDGICFPVREAAVPVPWSDHGSYQLQAMMSNVDGSPFLVDPRQALNALVARFHERGWFPVMATELEFYLIDPITETTHRPRPPVLGRGNRRRLNTIDAYSLDDVHDLEEFFAEVRATCDLQGVQTDTIISELGPGQFEINLQHVPDPLAAGDQAILFKRLIKGTARRHGYESTFMAKPYEEHSGNGFHVHFSLLDADGRNLFDNGGDEGSTVMRQAIAGLLAIMPDSMLVLAPHLNSYRRFQAGSHAPLDPCWGYENRTAALRVPDSEPSARRIEHRVAGADANPYLVLAVILAGALHGMDQRLQPAAPVAGDAYAAGSGERLPSHWADAIDRFEQSTVMRHYLGDQLVDVFVAMKRQEFYELSARISDVEYESYLGLI